MRRLVATWPITCGSHLPSAASKLKVRSSRVVMSIPPSHVVAEAVRRQQPLDMLLVGRRRCVEPVDDHVPDDPLLDCQSLLQAVDRGGRGLLRQRQFDVALGEDLVRGVQEVERLGHPKMRHSLHKASKIGSTLGHITGTHAGIGHEARL
ncbi:hypothetical protein ACQR2B_29355 [Bradyrhizobium oligotrophicum]|uniref:hypothetical protein n=1 Tax=Bradyrhizobium TaxID=374 RepID=UPI003EBA3820